MTDDDHRARLERLRDQLTAAIETCSENMLPQLSGQLRATLADLAALPPKEAKAETATERLRRERDERRSLKAV